jgi:hypothetical protein
MHSPPRHTGVALLKTSVIVMGVLIVLGLGAVVYGVISKTQSAFKLAEPLDAAKAAVVQLGLPAQTQLRSMAVSERTLVLHLAIPNQGEWIYLVPLSAEGRLLKIPIGPGESR